MTDETIETPAAPKTIPLHLFTVHGDPAPLFAALAKAQGGFAPIIRDKEVTVRTKPKDGQPSYTYTFKYAPIQNLKEACTPALSANELTVIQPFTRDSDGFTLRTILAHSSGAYLEAVVDGPNGDSWQALGSALTYAQRYSYAGMVGCVADDDDDGNQADGNQAQFSKAPPKAPQKPQEPPKASKPKEAPKPPPEPTREPEPSPEDEAAASDPVADEVNNQLVTPETERAIMILLRAKDEQGAPKFTMNSGRARIKQIVGRETRYQKDDGTWATNMTEAEGIKVIKELRDA